MIFENRKKNKQILIQLHFQIRKKVLELSFAVKQLRICKFYSEMIQFIH